jgi:hypothetical protein
LYFKIRKVCVKKQIHKSRESSPKSISTSHIQGSAKSLKSEDSFRLENENPLEIVTDKPPCFEHLRAGWMKKENPSFIASPNLTFIEESLTKGVLGCNLVKENSNFSAELPKLRDDGFPSLESNSSQTHKDQNSSVESNWLKNVEESRSSFTVGCDIAAGDFAINPRWQWIKVKNPNGIKSGNSSRAFGETAGIKEGAKLTVVAPTEDKVLVSYESPRGQGYGSEAGNGTLFFVSKEEFKTMTNDWERIHDKKEADKAKIKELLRKGFG